MSALRTITADGVSCRTGMTFMRWSPPTSTAVDRLSVLAAWCTFGLPVYHLAFLFGPPLQGYRVSFLLYQVSLLSGGVAVLSLPLPGGRTFTTAVDSQVRVKLELLRERDNSVANHLVV